MTKPKKMLRAMASVTAGLVLAAGVGVAGASGWNGGGWDGGGGNGHGDKKGGGGISVENENNVKLTNNNTQNAESGKAKVEGDKDKCGGGHGGNHWYNRCEGNGEGGVLGDATTGAASNENTTGLSVDIDNGSLCECLELGGDGHKKGSIKIDNDNNVVITNNNTQTATSGDATVEGGNGGSATTGDASNANTTTIGVTISN